MMRRLHILTALLLLASCAREERAVVYVAGNPVPFVAMECERLPDLNIPRSGHGLVWTGKELMAIGGHTTGFVPTQTAEIYNGSWRTVPMCYTHDDGFVLPTTDGEIVVGGGHAENFGVGGTLGVEVWNPAEKSFAPLPIMDRKRRLCTAAQLDDGTLLVAGNWRDDDMLGAYTPGQGFSTVKPMAELRYMPSILPSAPDNALIFGGAWVENGSGQVDRFRGEFFIDTLLQRWAPVSGDVPSHSEQYRIGDYTYLLAVVDSTGTYGVMKIEGEQFSLLPLDGEIPKAGPWGDIRYIPPLRTDPDSKRAWLQGIDPTHRVFLLEVRYAPALEGGAAGLVMHYTPDPVPDFPVNAWSDLLPGGRFAVAGGYDQDNYNVSSACFILYSEAKPGKNWWPWLLLLLLLPLLLLLRRGKTPPEGVEEVPAATEKGQEIMERITRLMEEDQIFRSKGLSVETLAQRLGTNKTYISAFVNMHSGMSFSAFVNKYRVEYAQRLMLENPEMKLADISLAAGFSSETSFFRNFRAITGKTPAEWRLLFKPKSHDGIC